MGAFDENEFMLAMHNMLEAVEKFRGCDAETAYQELAALLYLAAEERMESEA